VGYSCNPQHENELIYFFKQRIDFQYVVINLKLIIPYITIGWPMSDNCIHLQMHYRKTE